MLDLHTLRDEFSRYLNDNAGKRHSMDGALMHVCRVAYTQGLNDGLAVAERQSEDLLAGTVMAVHKKDEPS